MNIDRISWKMINAVQLTGRITIKQLAQQVGLSLPATSERLKKLEETGIITGYCARISPESVGYSVMAQVAITTSQPNKTKFIASLQLMPEVTECLHVAGADSYLLRVVTKDLKHLEDFVGAINHYGETRTSIVLSQPIPQRALNAVVQEH